MTDTEITQSTEKEPPAPPKHPWAELRPDRFRLLRLAPLPTERDGGARPLRFVELAQLERHTPEPLLRMFVNIPGQARSRKYNVLEVWADHRSKELRFGPTAACIWNPPTVASAVSCWHKARPGRRSVGDIIWSRADRCPRM